MNDSESGSLAEGSSAMREAWGELQRGLGEQKDTQNGLLLQVSLSKTA